MSNAGPGDDSREIAGLDGPKGRIMGIDYETARERQKSRHRASDELTTGDRVRCRWGGALPPHAGYYGMLSESAPEIGTRWRSEGYTNRRCQRGFEFVKKIPGTRTILAQQIA